MSKDILYPEEKLENHWAFIHRKLEKKLEAQLLDREEWWHCLIMWADENHNYANWMSNGTD